MSAKRLSPDEWAAARLAWESEPKLSISQIAARIGVSKQAANARSKREGWEKRADLKDLALRAHAKADKAAPVDKSIETPPPAPEVDEVDAPVNVNIAPPPVKKPEQHRPPVDLTAPVDARAEVLVRHRSELQAARRTLYESMKGKDFERGKLAKINLEAMSILQKCEAAAWGLNAVENPDQPPVVVIERS